MQKLLVGFSSSVAVVGVGLGVWSARLPDVDREMQVVGGRTTVAFFSSALESNGLRLDVRNGTAYTKPGEEPVYEFAIGESDLTYRLTEARLSSYIGGAVGHVGGFRILNGRRSLDATGFSIAKSGVTNTDLVVTLGRGKASIVAFTLESPRPSFDLERQSLDVGAMDLVLTAKGASALGRPDLAGLLVGVVNLYGDSKPIDGGGEVTGPHDSGWNIRPASAAIDVSISNLEALTVLGRVGTFPNGRNGLSMRTTSCNVGTQNIPWRAPMQEDHPVIAMNLYRLMNGRFEQVGWSWLKHGFFATNSPGCGTCIHPGTGSLLGPGCSDTYGTGNNGDRFYLGERKEVNPFAGTWECTGSWFSNYQPDCVRRNNGSGLDAVAHRLDVADADLGNAGAEYYYEAYYINASDFDRYNNISSRKASFTWSGTAWTASTIDAGQLQGPAIYRWGDMQAIAEPRDEGDVIVAAKVTDNGNGTWHYEYAVYNHDLDRQVDEFSIPLPFGAVVTNVGFRDIDIDGSNQWGSAVTNGAITWSTATNPLPYASVFNFRFDANVQPASSTATMQFSKPGTGAQLTAATRGPLVLQPVASFTPVFATVFAGDLQSLKDSDNDSLSLNRGIALSSNSGMGIETSITGPAGAVTQMLIGIESRDSTGNGSGGERRTQLWNWSTSAWDQVDVRPTTTSDTFFTVVLTSGLGNYVKSDTREVRARFMHAFGLSLTSNRPAYFDVVGFKFN